MQNKYSQVNINIHSNISIVFFIVSVHMILNCFLLFFQRVEDPNTFCISQRKFAIAIAIAGLILMIAVIIAILILVSKRRRKNLSTTGDSRAADTGRSLNIVFFEDSRLWARQCMYSVCMTDRRAGQVGQRQNLWRFYLKWKFPISLQVRLLVGRWVCYYTWNAST